MMDYRKILICLVLFSIPFLCHLPELSSEEVKSFHTKEELAKFQMINDSLLPHGYNGLFLGSGACIQCHGYDSTGFASTDLAGRDVNVVDDWRASMMANSAKDPFWRAKVSHETLLYPEHKDIIETKCTSCHAPLGHFAAFHNGETHYTIEDLKLDSLGQDGVSCLSCHQQDSVGIGSAHSGNLVFDTSRVSYGPYISPLESPMLMATDYRPVYSEHISDAGVCAGCHTLVTETIDLEGNFTGNTFVEQATYHEWLNSDFNTEDISCQSCHMPALSKGSINIVSGFETEPRSPFYLHEFAGANTMMLNLMKENIDALGIGATAEQFDEAISATVDMLRNKSINLDLSFIEVNMDTAFFELEIENKAGHKFPSGYPSRRVFVEFSLLSEMGDTIFISGKQDENFEVYGQNADFEPHYNIINSPEQVQIYELVIGDVNGDVTTVLERGDRNLKDNRLPPKGFITEHYTYDTVQITGQATTDEDFNKLNGVQGTGIDKVYYQIPLNGMTGMHQATARVYYQTAPPKWMKEMFDEQTAEIDVFRDMFNATDRSPILVKERRVDLDIAVATNNLFKESRIKIQPNITNSGLINIESDITHDLFIYNADGRPVKNLPNQSGNYTVQLPTIAGIYFLKFITKDNKSVLEKCMVF